MQLYIRQKYEICIEKSALLHFARLIDRFQKKNKNAFSF